ncbi:MAG: prepilin peptidase [Acidaminobacteraceae bacterium]
MNIIFLILGAIFGSFFNVCIYRIPNGKSIINPPSSCGSCDHILNFRDMVPVIGYFLNRGRCRYCGEKYSIRYALVELLTAVSFLLVYIKMGLAFEILFILAIVSMIIIMIFIDLDHHIIPDGLNLLIGLSGLAYGIYNNTSIKSMILGFLVGGVIIFIVAIIGPMGGGDIKLFAALGIWLGPLYTSFAIVISFILGGIIGVLLIVLKIKGRKDHIAFGPFIGIAGLMMILFGNEIINWYITLVI